MPTGGKDAFLSKVTFRRESKWYSKTKQELKELNNMATIEERAKEYAARKADISLSDIYNEALANIYKEAYIAGATEQKTIDIDNVCNILCHYACSNKIDSNKCCNTECKIWKMFRRMMEE